MAREHADRTAGLAATLLLALAAPAVAQQGPPTCDTPAHAQFDFWVGQWALSWGDSAQGTNVIRRTHAGCVIEERFSGERSMPLRGTSLSLYDRAAGQWRQVWVDNQGSWLDFTGGWRGDRMLLEREAVVQGLPVRQRMVWFDIRPDGLTWHWERSRDDGATWEVLWAIAYRRVE